MRFGVKVVVVVVVALSAACNSDAPKVGQPDSLSGASAQSPKDGGGPLAVVRVLTEWDTQFHNCAAPAIVDVERDVVSGTALTVNYEVTGPVEPTPGSVDIAPGNGVGLIELTPTSDAASGGTVHFKLTAGDGYEIGTPSSTEVHVMTPDACAATASSLGRG